MKYGLQPLLGGCFWCMEQAMDKVKGVITSTSGYIGGHQSNPTYHAVSSGGTGHTEAVKIEYDPKLVTYAELLKVFWKNIDPTTPNRQFCDRGNQYRSGIFYHNSEQKRLADVSLAGVIQNKSFSEPIVTEITAAGDFLFSRGLSSRIITLRTLYAINFTNTVRDISLAEAREKAVECRKVVHEGKDPIEEKKASLMSARIEAAKGITFTECATAYIEANRSGWSNPKHAQQWTNTLKNMFTPLSAAFQLMPLIPPWSFNAWNRYGQPSLKPHPGSEVELKPFLDYATTREYRQGGEQYDSTKSLLQMVLPFQNQMELYCK